MNTNIAFFDLDGVLARHDTMAILVRHRLLARPARFIRAFPALLLLAGAALSGRQSPVANRRLVRVALSGLDESDYAALARATAVDLADRRGFVLPGALALANHWLRQGRLVVVSGSERHLARAYLDAIGLQSAELIASELGFTDGPVRFVDHTIGDRKLDRVTEAGIDPAEAVFVTDSRSDLPLARAAHEVVLVNPNRSTERAFRRSVRRLDVVRW